MRLLLVQVRRATDAMAQHERECIARRVTQPVQWVVRNAYTDVADSAWLQGVDGVVVGGSGDFSVHDPRSAPWLTPLKSLVSRTLQRELAFFGICFGHQVLGACLGSDVLNVPAHAEIGTCRYELTEEGTHDPVFGSLPQSFRAQAGHSDSVIGVPVGVSLMVSNCALDTQAFRVAGELAYSTQFHPDMTGSEARARYLAYKDGFLEQSPDHARGAEMFTLEADEATPLLRNFVDHARGRCGA